MSSSRGLSVATSREQALQARHAEISRRIEAQEKRPAISDIEVRMLKKIRLRVKEELEGMRQTVN
jgi:hypothetical protein